ncbi:DMSO/TMAO reductase YedYZ molybdopterin-dependent catalytic subunit [Leifsonia sp. AK011]|uniref:molybdopterin-dependent oxidoreductase n=1 Tax=Leifsonia sp. AK011 TaxID=2723075 RepID=UPI0015C839D9|nr:molybdopterin-dependent oxidoreductase [Leifsonia sp. AK011]NYF11427.1 DMSO/TMAO reductase YedYZ molybdopterin-dependent catalytic subunit [Leifsonia sp. AK011]
MLLIAERTQRVLHELRHALIAPSRRPRTTVVVGRVLGIAFLLCFATGLYSHFLQEPLPGMAFLTRPVWIYQLTQGIHVTAGIACIPLLLAKLYTVFPRLFTYPPVTSLANLLERASIALLVSASLVQVTIGLLNTYQLYRFFPFSFRTTHWVLSFVIIGSLLVHLAVKLPVIAAHWRASDATPAPDPDAVRDVPDELRRVTGRRMDGGLTGRLFAWIDREEPIAEPDARAAVSRRGFLATVTLATATVVAFTAGQSTRALAGLNLFAPRAMGVGPQGLPVNRTARAADVVEAATSADWALTVVHGERSAVFSLADLRALPLTEARLPIACVEGWSQDATWRGPRVRDLLDAVDAPHDASVRVVSLQTNSRYGHSTLSPEFARDELTLVALDLEGEPLHLDHGFPARLIAPARPGVLQTKWLSVLEVIV